MAVEIKQPTYFNFKDTDVDFSEIMYSNASEDEIDAFVNKTNMNAVDSFVPNNIDAEIDSLVQADNPENPSSWLYNHLTVEELEAHRKKGKIDFYETWERMNKWEMIPYLNGIATVEDVKILNLLRKTENEPENITEEERAKVAEFFNDMAEIEARGYTFMGKALQGVTTSLAFMGEFVLTGGLLSLGKKGVKEGVKGAVKKTVKSTAKKMIGESIARTALAPHRVADSYVNRRISGGIAFTDQGMGIYKEMSEAPSLTFFKSLGDVWVSQASELAGEYFLGDAYKVLGKKVGARLPKGFKGAFANYVKSETGETITQGMAKFGWNGLLEEMGEERLESFMRMTLGLEDEEYNFKNIVGSIGYENIEEFALEGVTVISGGMVARGGAMAINKITKHLKDNGVKLTKEEETELINSVLVMGTEQRQQLMQKIQETETEADLELYNQRISSFRQMVEANIPAEQVDSNMKLIEAMTAVASQKTGIKRSDLVLKMPIVQQGDAGGLRQENQDLIQEARKYKSAEEFIDSQLENNDLPEQKTIPNKGRLSFIKTDDGSIYFDVNEGAHAKIITDQKIPAHRVKSGGFIVDGVELQSQSPNAPRIGEQARAKRAVRRRELTDIYNQSQELKQEDITPAPAFKEWFGDSKVVDENGEPLVVYHGTDKKGIIEFKSEKGMYYFAENKEYTKEFEEIYEGRIGETKEVYLSIFNPLNLTEIGLEKISAKEFIDKFPVDISEKARGNIEARDKIGHKRAYNYIREIGQEEVKKLKEAGYDGIVQMDKSSDGVETKAYIAFDSTQIKSVENRGTFDTTDANIYRQSKQGAYNPNLNLISMLEDADQSTFIHEMSHWFLELYMNNAPQELTALYKFAGIEQGKELTEPEYRRLHETFARGFESYLMQGKAPNKGLADVFSKFKDWLLGIYQNVAGLNRAGGIDVTLNDDIVAFYDSLLNVEQEVEIDSTMADKIKPPKERMTLYQEAEEQLKKIKKIKKATARKYGKKAKADLKEYNSIIRELEYAMAGVKTKSMRQEAEAAFSELPVEELGKIKSKKQFIDNYIKTQYAGRNVEAEAEELQKGLNETIEKIKAQAKLEAPTQLQAEVIKTIRDLDIAKADKVNFLGLIQKAKTPYSQKKVLMEMLDRSENYWSKQQRNELDKRIQKMLKQVKPTKKDAVEKGKYAYEDNMLFVQLREYNKMTQQEALELFEKTGLEDTEESIEKLGRREILERMFLAYKAFGKSKGSLSLFEETHSLLREAIQLAKESKDESAFNDKLNLQKVKIEFADGINSRKFKGDKDSITTKILDLYRNGNLFFGANQWSFLNSIAGEKIADKWNMEIQEKNRNIEISQAKREAIQNAVDIFGFEKESEFFSKLVDTYVQEKHQLTNTRVTSIDTNITREFNRFGIIDIYNAIKNDKIRKDYFREYGELNVMDLVNKLSSQEREWADSLQQQAESKWEDANRVHIKQTGLPLGQYDEGTYWPNTAVINQSKINDDLTFEVTMAGFQKQRSKGAVIPVPVDGWLKFDNYISGVAQVSNIQEKYLELRKVLDDMGVKDLIEQKYSEETYKTLIKQVKALSLKGLRNEIKGANDGWHNAFNNWVKSKIGLNVSVFSKQLLSTSNYIEQMPTTDWVKGFAEGLANPKQTLAFMFEHSEYLPDRYKRGYAEAIQRAIKEGKRSAGKMKFDSAVTSLVRMGDIGAIVYGGYPMVKYLTETKGMSMEQAIEAFEKATIRSQQSPLTSSLDLFQQDRGFFQSIFGVFSNTPRQYARKTFDAMIGYYNKDIDAKTLARKLVIYNLVQGGGYGLVSWLMGNMLYGGDDDNPWDDILIGILAGPFNAFPLIKTFFHFFAKYGANAMGHGDKPWRVFSLPFISDLEFLMKSQASALFNGEWSLPEMMELLTTGAELRYGAPVENLTNLFSRVTGIGID